MFSHGKYIALVGETAIKTLLVRGISKWQDQKLKKQELLKKTC